MICRKKSERRGQSTEGFACMARWTGSCQPTPHLRRCRWACEVPSIFRLRAQTFAVDGRSARARSRATAPGICLSATPWRAGLSASRGVTRMDCGKTSAKSLIYVIVRCGYRTISRHD